MGERWRGGGSGFLVVWPGRASTVAPSQIMRFLKYPFRIYFLCNKFTHKQYGMVPKCADVHAQLIIAQDTSVSTPCCLSHARQVNANV